MEPIPTESRKAFILNPFAIVVLIDCGKFDRR
jgi:hypothetical protein